MNVAILTALIDALKQTKTKDEVSAIEAAIRAVTSSGERFLKAAALLVWLQRGKIPAIKFYREMTGAGLKASKEAVESVDLETVFQNILRYNNLCLKKPHHIFAWLSNNFEATASGRGWAGQLGVSLIAEDGWRTANLSFTDDPISLFHFIELAQESTIQPQA
jgi:ribosomal protein L7/L12